VTPQPKPSRVYTTVGPEPYKPPDYERVVRRQTDEELRSDIAAGRGDEGYRDAARAELERRETI
jgi:hypothetical protein